MPPEIRAAELHVALGPRSYGIHIGAGLLAQAGALLRQTFGDSCQRALLVADRAIAPLYADTVTHALAQAGIAAPLIQVEGGESGKSFAALELLCETLLSHAPDRHTPVIALGGGVVGDLAGLAASLLLRGVPMVQMPTTLLSQVDSAVGGKTAINSRHGKNLIGSFHQPSLVMCDSETLRSLPPRHWRAGYAEILKTALIADEALWHWCQSQAAGFLKPEGDAAALHHAVGASLRHKAAIVGRDERESGERALLNFGHTFAHALELELGYDGRLLHGEAVAIGMVMAARLSAQLGLCEPALAGAIAQHLRDVGLPDSLAAVAHDWDAQRLLANMQHDKKTRDGALTFILLRAPGMAQVQRAVPAAAALAVLQEFCSAARTA